MDPDPSAAPGDDAARTERTGAAQHREAPHQESPHQESHPQDGHPREDWGTQTTEIARDALRAAAAAAVKRRRRRFPRLGRSD